jgi:hypothetical protein
LSNTLHLTFISFSPAANPKLWSQSEWRHFLGALTLTDLVQPDTDIDTDANANANVRTIRVTTWLSAAEAKVIDEKRGLHGRSRYLRFAGLGRRLARAPDPVAQDQWADLARLQANLYQLVRHLNGAVYLDGSADRLVTLDRAKEINLLISELRAWLIRGRVSSKKVA